MPEMQAIRMRNGYFDNYTYAFVNFPLTGDQEKDGVEISLKYPVIELFHYENPRATMQGVTILGITQAGPDDIKVVDRYMFSGIDYGDDTSPTVIWYELVKTDG